MTRIKRSIETIWEEYPKTYPSGVDVSRREATRISGQRVPRCGYEVPIASRVHTGHKQTMYLQNISNAVFRFRVYTDVCFVS
jgi:hypothetical protein